LNLIFLFLELFKFPRMKNLFLIISFLALSLMSCKKDNLCPVIISVWDPIEGTFNEVDTGEKIDCDDVLEDGPVDASYKD
jgi:hypothetical protein